MPPRLTLGYQLPATQRGAILVVSLLVLTALTLLALGTSQTFRMQERMATALRERDVAFQVAEAALRAGERVVGDPTLASTPSPCASGRCRIYARDALGVSAVLQPADWWSNRAWAYAAANAATPNEQEDQDARFLIEELAQIPDALTISPYGPPSGRTYYRITSMGRASADAAQVILQSTFARRFTPDAATLDAMTSQWDGRERLPAQRQIVATNSDGTPVAFRWAALDALRQALLGEDALSVQRLRGDAVEERSQAPMQADNEQRPSGATLSSARLFVGAPRLRYHDSLETVAYSRFVNAHSKRAGMVYAAMSDGLVHGFDAVTGIEAFAFIPSPVLARLGDRTAKSHESRPTIGGSPTMADVPFAGAWHTILVGGLNQGGQGIYALDITDPTSFPSAETDPGRLVLWEFTEANDADLGSTYSQPVVVRLQDGTWAAIFGNGYGSQAADGIASTTGNAVLYIVDAATGELIRKLDTGVGVAHAPSGITGGNGLSTPAIVDTNGDRIVDCAYAGDLYGNLWKFDLSAKRSADWTVNWSSKPLYRARSTNGNAQPITVRPEIARSADRNGVIVLFGTGEPAELADKPSRSHVPQSLYGIVDRGTGPIADRGKLQVQAITGELVLDPDGDGPLEPVNVRTTTNSTLGAHSGWYMDLVSPSGADQGEKLVINPRVVDGKVILGTFEPAGDPNGSASKVWIWALDAASGSGSDVNHPLFDLTRDGRVNAKDTVTTTVNGMAIRVAVAALASSAVAEGAWQSAVAADEGLGATYTHYIHSPGSAQRATSITLRCGLGDTGRQSWRQLQ